MIENKMFNVSYLINTDIDNKKIANNSITIDEKGQNLSIVMNVLYYKDLLSYKDEIKETLNKAIDGMYEYLILSEKNNINIDLYSNSIESGE